MRMGVGSLGGGVVVAAMAAVVGDGEAELVQFLGIGVIRVRIGVHLVRARI